MKNIRFLLIAVLAGLGLSACNTQRMASTSEYDDVYYSGSDNTQLPQEQVQTEDSYASQQTYREPVDSYQDAYYEDDDFAFSRRLRRFDRGAGNSNFRYYDPYYMNDLYFVMGTPYWNRWNNMGWYNWNRPRFGATWSMGFGDPFFNPYNPWNNMGRYNGFYGNGFYGNNYYNPWVNSYYGYNAWGSPYGWNTGFGFNNGGFGNGFYSPYYCPPVGFVSGNQWNRYTETTQRAVRQRDNAPDRRAMTPQGGKPTRTTADNRRPVSSNGTGTVDRRATSSTSRQYLEPRRPQSTVTNRASTNTSRRTPTYTRDGSVNSSPRTGSATSTNGRSVPTYRAPSSRTYTQPANRTSTAPSRSAEQRTYSVPSRNYNRPQASPNRSTSPSRSVSPSRNTSPNRNYSPSRSTSPSRNYSPSRSSSPSRSVSPSRSSSPSRSTGGSRPSGGRN